MNDKLTVDEKRKKLEELLVEFGVKKLRKAPSIALSGGERRRVEIARAFHTEGRGMWKSRRICRGNTPCLPPPGEGGPAGPNEGKAPTP